MLVRKISRQGPYLVRTDILSGEQIRELMFADKADSSVRRRLSALSRGTFPYVRRLPFRTRDGSPVVSWSLTSLGCQVAQNSFGPSPQRSGRDLPAAEFLERQVLLSGLYIALAAGASRAGLRLKQWPFRWNSSDQVRLRWQGGLLRPDALLELPEGQRRIFIELEIGTRLLDLRRAGSPVRWTMRTKVERYQHFMASSVSNAEGASSSELLFVVKTNAWRDALAECADSCRRDSGPLVVNVTTLDEAPEHLLRAARLPAPPAITQDSENLMTTLTAAETRALYGFYNDAIAAISAVRRFAKDRLHDVLNLPIPEYPPNHHEVREVCLRLRKSLAP
jgi:hypothetical protein